MLDADGPSFSILISGPAFLISLAMVIAKARTCADAPTRFLLFAVWCRYAVAMFHEITYKPVAGGLSIVALVTVVLIGLGIVTLGPRAFRYARLVPFYLFAAAACVSSVLNGTWMGLFNNGLKWVFLILITAAAYEAMKQHGARRLFRSVAIVFVVPLVLQWISYLIDLKKVSQSSSTADLAVSFIAGYQHQAGFSVIVLTFLYVVIFAQAERFLVSLAGVGLALFGIVLCDYRTAMIAAVCPAAAFLLVEIVRRFRSEERAPLVAVAAALLVVATVTLIVPRQERFADLFVIAEKGASLVKPPEHYTEPEQKMLSGRAILWSDYISSYARLGTGALIVGSGADSWVGQFSLYAHNSFVSFLYEYGALGVTLFAGFLVSGFLTALRAAGIHRLVLASCHLGYLLLSLGTMPMWLVEGGILYGLLLARTWYAHLEWQEVVARPRRDLLPRRDALRITRAFPSARISDPRR